MLKLKKFIIKTIYNATFKTRKISWHSQEILWRHLFLIGPIIIKSVKTGSVTGQPIYTGKLKCIFLIDLFAGRIQVNTGMKYILYINNIFDNSWNTSYFLFYFMMWRVKQKPYLWVNFTIIAEVITDYKSTFISDSSCVWYMYEIWKILKVMTS